MSNLFKVAAVTTGLPIQVKAEKAPLGVIEQIYAAQKAESSGEEWDYGTNLVALQKSIEDGSAWRLEGSWGRAAIEALESGACFLPEQPVEDYWGGVVPGRSSLKPGTKGTIEHSMKFWGIKPGPTDLPPTKSSLDRRTSCHR